MEQFKELQNVSNSNIELNPASTPDLAEHIYNINVNNHMPDMSVDRRVSQHVRNQQIAP